MKTARAIYPESGFTRPKIDSVSILVIDLVPQCLKLLLFEILESLLSFPKPFVNSVVFQQLTVASRFGNGTLFHNVNSVGIYDVCKAVGNENDGFCFCKAVYFTHNVVFAFGVYVGGCLVKNINRAVV